MNVTLSEVPAADKSVLRQLMELYCYDFSEYDGLDVNAHGFYGYEYLDHYWIEAGRQPFFIKVDGNLAGFVLVSDYCHELVAEGSAHSIAEFFVMRKYRRQGVGRIAARAAFDRFPGRWVVMQHKCNVPSLYFWERVIGEYTGNRFEKRDTTLESQGKLWACQALIFETP